MSLATWFRFSVWPWVRFRSDVAQFTADGRMPERIIPSQSGWVRPADAHWQTIPGEPCYPFTALTFPL